MRSAELAQPKLILGSASPRRRELLSSLGVVFDCRPADIDETPRTDELPLSYVERMAREKAQTIARQYPAPDFSVLAADTTVVVDGALLGKPTGHTDGLAMLARLSGQTHTVMSAVCLSGAFGEVCEVVQTQVTFFTLSHTHCEAYLATDEPWDKAGAYAIQGLGGAFVKSINGSYSNVVGLPLCETWQLLCNNGIATLLDAPLEQDQPAAQDQPV